MLLVSRSRDSYHHGDLAEALEAAALRLLEDHPAAEISLREVARAADVSHSAPYHHFTDRRGLLKVLAERSMSVLVAEVSEAAAAAPDDIAAMIAGGAAYIRFAAERVHAFDVVYDPAVCIPGHPTATMAPLITELETVLARACAAVGLDTEDEANAVWGLMHGLGTLVGAGHFDLAAGTAAFRSAVTRMIAAPS